MLHLLKTALLALLPADQPRDQMARWRADPLSHPVISRMSLSELADLPLEPAEPQSRHR